MYLTLSLTLVGPCKVSQESLGSWIPHCRFRIPCLWITDSTSQKWLDSRFHKLDSGFHVCGFQIPCQWIRDFMAQKWLDSGYHKLDSSFQRLKFLGFQISDYLSFTWANSWNPLTPWGAYRSRTNVLHFPFFFANFPSSLQDFPIAFSSCSVDLRQVAHSLPLFLFPWGFLTYLVLLFSFVWRTLALII